ncbi:hypothetical protein B0O80DRAFT_423081 [Mortierella sp. GBAus27b]|nr:hypothetical protein B0O80DRAFT_423081 [Mortierella sp. GBAus27b]
MFPRAFILTLTAVALATTLQAATVSGGSLKPDQHDLSLILATEASAQAMAMKRRVAATKRLDTTVVNTKHVKESKRCHDGDDNADSEGESSHGHGHDHHGHDHHGHHSDGDQDGSGDHHEDGSDIHDESQSSAETFTTTVSWPTSTIPSMHPTTSQSVDPTTTGQPSSAAATGFKGRYSGAAVGLVAVVLAVCLV